MDREMFRARLPASDAFGRLPLATKCDVVSEQIRLIISAIEQERREPDVWEAHSLGHACDSMAIGFFSLALTECDVALTPAAERADSPPREPASRVTLNDLRRREAQAYQSVPRN